MKQHPLGKGDWLFIAIVICVAVLVFWIFFGRMVAEALGGGR